MLYGYIIKENYLKRTQNMNLYKLRKQMGLTQKEVAEHLECSILAYSRYERSYRNPSVEMLIKMSKFFNVSIDYLVGNVKDLERNELTEYEKELLVAARNSDERARYDALKLLMDYQKSE